MVIPLKHPQKIILHQIELFIALLLIRHEGDARETRRDDTEW
jgi:hypothetical protein